MPDSAAMEPARLRLIAALLAVAALVIAALAGWTQVVRSFDYYLWANSAMFAPMAAVAAHHASRLHSGTCQCGATLQARFCRRCGETGEASA